MLSVLITGISCLDFRACHFVGAFRGGGISRVACHETDVRHVSYVSRQGNRYFHKNPEHETDVRHVTCVSQKGFQQIQHFPEHETDVKGATSVSRKENRQIQQNPGLETEAGSATSVSRMQILYQNQCTKKFKHTTKRFNSHIFLFL